MFVVRIGFRFCGFHAVSPYDSHLIAVDNLAGLEPLTVSK